MWLVIKKSWKKKQKTEPIRAYHRRKDERFAKEYESMKYDVQGGQEIKKLITRSFIKEAVPVQGHARTKKT